MAQSTKKSDYSANKKMFAFKSDCELRGINATCKQIVALYDAKDNETIATLAYDAISVDVFRDKSFVDVAKVYTPNYFTSNGQICRLVKLYAHNEETKQRFANLSETCEYLQGSDGNGDYKFFKIPVFKWTTLGLYNFAKRALKAKDKAGKQAEKLANISTAELQNELAKRTESTESKPESKTTKKASK